MLEVDCPEWLDFRKFKGQSIELAKGTMEEWRWEEDYKLKIPHLLEIREHELHLLDWYQDTSRKTPSQGLPDANGALSMEDMMRDFINGGWHWFKSEPWDWDNDNHHLLIEEFRKKPSKQSDLAHSQLQRMCYNVRQRAIWDYFTLDRQWWESGPVQEMVDKSQD